MSPRQLIVTPDVTNGYSSTFMNSLMIANEVQLSNTGLHNITLSTQADCPSLVLVLSVSKKQNACRCFQELQQCRVSGFTAVKIWMSSGRVRHILPNMPSLVCALHASTPQSPSQEGDTAILLPSVLLSQYFPWRQAIAKRTCLGKDC